MNEEQYYNNRTDRHSRPYSAGSPGGNNRPAGGGRSGAYNRPAGSSGRRSADPKTGRNDETWYYDDIPGFDDEPQGAPRGNESGKRADRSSQNPSGLRNYAQSNDTYMHAGERRPGGSRPGNDRPAARRRAAKAARQKQIRTRMTIIGAAAAGICLLTAGCVFAGNRSGRKNMEESVAAASSAAAQEAAAANAASAVSEATAQEAAAAASTAEEMTAAPFKAVRTSATIELPAIDKGVASTLHIMENAIAAAGDSTGSTDHPAVTTAADAGETAGTENAGEIGDGSEAGAAGDGTGVSNAAAGSENEAECLTEPDDSASAGTTATDDPKYVDSEYAILINVDDGTIVAERNADVIISPASMTKILTLLCAVEHIDNFDDTFTITQDITDYTFRNGCSVAGFELGSSVSVRDLLYGMILPSGADGALGTANYVAGSQENFAKLMNEKIDALGLSDTAHFDNVTGVYSDHNYCTVYDMAMILAAAVQNETALDVLSAHTWQASATNQDNPDGILLSNWFLRRIEDKDSGGTVIAGKTGYVQQSGSCAASYYVSNQGTHYICVTGNAYSPWRCIRDHVALYKNYTDTVDAVTEGTGTEG